MQCHRSYFGCKLTSTVVRGSALLLKYNGKDYKVITCGCTESSAGEGPVVMVPTRCLSLLTSNPVHDSISIICHVTFSLWGGPLGTEREEKEANFVMSL